MSKAEGSEDRFGRVLDSIDAKSRSLEKSLKAKFRNNSDKAGQISEEKVDEISSQTTIDPKNEEIDDNSKTKRLDLQTRFNSFSEMASRVFNSFSNKMNAIWISLPFLIPTLVIFQTALWLAFLSDDSISGEIIQNRVDGFGEAGKSITILLSIFGAIGGYLLSSSFDNNSPYGDFSLLPEVVDIMFIVLVLSAILYLLKKTQSLYYLYLVIFGSIIIRLVETDLSSYNYISIVVQLFGLTLFSMALSSPILGYRKSLNEKESTIDTSLLDIDSSIPTEYSYHGPYVHDLGISMDQAPVSKPRRPSRRSEYELYEWVLLLANLILWPSVVIISIILGSGSEVAGGTYNLEENYLMLVGPLLLTIFFFTILYKMDSNARDGSLYQAEKQSYLDEMEKYLEARTAYLELVTLQAQMKKEEMINPSSEE
jgi:hypothetical protein